MDARARLERMAYLLSRVKRDLPPLMTEGYDRIERWRSTLLADVHTRADISAYLLTSTACKIIGEAVRRLMPRRIAAVERLTRQQLSGLESALAGIRVRLCSASFSTDVISSSFSAWDTKRAIDVIDKMYLYSCARDVRITYSWGGYDLVDASDHVLRFTDSSDWQGSRDQAGRMISLEIKTEHANAFSAGGRIVPGVIPEEAIDILPQLPVGDLKAEAFASTWIGVATELGQNWVEGRTDVVERESLVEMVKMKGNLSSSGAESFVSMVTFRSEDVGPLTLFHCPVVPLTQSSMMLIAPGFISGNPGVCIRRLVVHRGDGLDAYSTDIEKALLDRLEKQFGGKETVIRRRVRYSHSDDEGDIDLVVYESSENRLLIAMVKAFIPPDTVEEVVRANDRLEDGLQQLERARAWLGTLSDSELSRSLRVPSFPARPVMRFTVLGNGFSGSDYLEIPQDVAVVDVQYVLLPKFGGESVFSAIDCYLERLSLEISRAAAGLRMRAIELGDVKIEYPAWIYPI